MNKRILLPCLTLLAAGLAVAETEVPPAPGTKPAAEKPAKPADKDKTKGATEITAKDASFDQKKHVGVFTGAVTVQNPQFNIKCDKLTAYMRHDDNKDASPAGSTGPAGAKDPKAAKAPAPAGGNVSGRLQVPKPAATPATPTITAKAEQAGKGALGGSDQKPSALEKAIAEGGVIITQDKTDADGKVEHDTGHAQRAYYDATSGDVTLTGRPDVQQGGNVCISLDDSTIMILNRDGHMRVHGPHKTVLADTSASESDPKNSNAH